MSDPTSDPRIAIRQRAASLGLDRIGFADADVPPEAAHLDSWLERDFHGRMEWMRRGRDRRLDPQKVLPSARAFVVGALAYAAPGAAPQAPPRPDRPARPGADTGEPRGFVARYARGEDYHRVLGSRLRDLAGFIREIFPGHRALEYVDTGAILERMWAARAGVGWIGKNGLVLNREMGSYFSLGVIITTAPLPADEPALDQCGACALCIEACPTGAIVEPRVVDSRRCLSYLTIELRGPLPAGHRDAIGDRVLGCDDCQDACPWNRQSGAPSGAPDTAWRPESTDPSLEELIFLSFEAWDARFRRSAVRRATWQGLRRNAVVAAGNAEIPAGDRPRWIERLAKLEQDPAEDPIVREEAGKSVERLLARRIPGAQ